MAASTLDRDSYQAHEVEGGMYIQSVPPDDVAQALQRDNEDLQRAQEATRLIVRYHIERTRGHGDPVGDDELVADLAIARHLLESPPTLNATDPWDSPTAVAAVALEAHLLRGVVLPDDALTFAAETALHVADGAAGPRHYELEDSYFEQAADRNAARVLPLLLLAAAAPLRALVDGADGSTTYERATAAGVNLAHAIANEVRLRLARGLDRVWEEPCAQDGPCPHEVALRLAIETMRDCALGDWDPEIGQRRILVLDELVCESLANTAGDAIFVSRLDAAIRALAPAAMANICVSARARDLLMNLFDAQRRSLHARDQDMDQRGTHALVSARALLTLAADGEDSPILQHIDAYADKPTPLGSFLRALSAAAEERSDYAATARRIWPHVITHVLELNESGHTPFDDDHYGDMALAASCPMPQTRSRTSTARFRTRRSCGGSRSHGGPRSRTGCRSHLVTPRASTTSSALSVRSRPKNQVRTGLPWVGTLVLPDPSLVAGRSFLLSTWMIEIRSAAVDARLLADWQRIADALVVAGVSRLAPYSE
jgi:hypothetical protein